MSTLVEVRTGECKVMKVKCKTIVKNKNFFKAIPTLKDSILTDLVVLVFIHKVQLADILKADFLKEDFLKEEFLKADIHKESAVFHKELAAIHKELEVIHQLLTVHRDL